MKLNVGERLMMNNPFRAFVQRHIEGPMLRKLGSRKNYPLCLEIGCGRGIGAQVIIEQFGAEKVIATDIDPEQIERAKRNLKDEFKDRIEFRVADAMSIDEPEEKFDAVFSFGVMHHTEDWRKAVKEIARVLKKGGEFFFEEPLKDFVRFFVKGGLLKFIAEHPAGGMFDFSEFRTELERHNIKIVNIKRLDNIAIFGAGKKMKIS